MNTPTTRYLVVLMRRAGFDERLVAPHIAFLDELRADGLLELNGGFSDRSGGAYLLRGIASLEEAEAIVARDPLAVHGASGLGSVSQVQRRSPPARRDAADPARGSRPQAPRQVRQQGRIVGHYNRAEG